MFLLLQLENYETARFIKSIYTHPYFLFGWKKRQRLDYTPKMIAIISLTVLSQIVLIGLARLLYQNLLLLLWAAIVSGILLPIIVAIFQSILYPLDIYLKQRLVSKAKNKLNKMNKLIVIWITGSFGKTTQKDILSAILSTKFKVLTTEDNKNTPLWISKTVINKLDSNHEVFIVEMWAHIEGDIKEICDLVHPKIGILTWIWPQHLERFGNLKNILKTKFELIDNLPADGFAVINQHIRDIWQFMEKHIYAVQKIKAVTDNIQIEYLPNFAGIKFAYDWHNFQSKLLAKHSSTNIILAYEVAKYLWVTTENILHAVKKIEYTPHRLQLIYNALQNTYIIDDSYNGNIEWVRSTVDMIEHTPFAGKKMYITPWLVELGKDSHKIHTEIGNLLYRHFDKILLINNRNTKTIEQTLLNNGFLQENIRVYATAAQAHKDIKNILHRWDLMVFQNDLTDNYL